MVKKRLTKFTRSPVGILAGILFGGMFGSYYPHMGQIAGPFGQLIINLLKMCVIPIIVSSITLGLKQIVASKSGVNLRRITIIFFSTFALTGAMGVLVGSLGEPGHKVDIAESPSLHKIVVNSSTIERGVEDSIEKKAYKGFLELVKGFVPSNIFTSFAEDNIFQIVVFSIIFALAFASLPSSKKEENVQDVLDTVYQVFQKIIGIVTSVLPFAIFCIAARDVTKVGIETIVSMITFLGYAYVAFALLFIVNLILIKVTTKRSLSTILSTFKFPIFISFSTSSTVATIPYCIDALTKLFENKKNLVTTLTPLSMVIGRYGNIIYLAFAAIFVSQIYGANLSIIEYSFIALISSLAGMSTMGMSGGLTMGALMMILDPLGLPVSALLVVFIAIDPLIEPVRTLSNTFSNCAAIALSSSE